MTAGRRMKMEPSMPVVKIARGEIEHILKLKESFNHGGTLLAHAINYLNLGWALVAIDAETGNNLEIDFEDLNTYIKRLEDPSVDTATINLAVHTGSLSRLLVLEVANAEESSCLDEWGAWRSQCMAKSESGLEKHFYLLSPDSQPLPANEHLYAEGATTLLPPSLDPVTQERWRWQHSPWDSAPSPLPLSILNYLHSLQEPAAAGPDLEDQPRVSWRELYCAIAPLEAVLQAFGNEEASMDDYYENLFRAALETGLTDADLLLSLLWYAPLGDARQQPERWAKLQKLVSQVRLLESSQSPKFLEDTRTICSVKAPYRNSREKGKVDRQPISRRAIKNG
jgi:hypothetical protein